LTQIFDNLVSNAVKFSEPGGSVSVAFEVDGERVLARVLDDGVGIRSEHLAYIFEPFHQEVQELARTTGGLGLGLALVRSLVEMHGGSVEAHSKGLGTGAEFHVAFPRTDPKGEGSEATSATEIPPLRILLIEDSRDLVETLRLLLEADGHEARTARSGSEALEILGSYDPDVILCDLGLPGMSGYEVARSVRGTGSSIPLVALTGYGQPEDRARTSDAGFDHHLVKPVDIARLRTVFEILELPRG
jgi:CheY-like chemotaxis protein